MIAVVQADAEKLARAWDRGEQSRPLAAQDGASLLERGTAIGVAVQFFGQDARARQALAGQIEPTQVLAGLRQVSGRVGEVEDLIVAEHAARADASIMFKGQNAHRRRV